MEVHTVEETKRNAVGLSGWTKALRDTNTLTHVHFLHQLHLSSPVFIYETVAQTTDSGRTPRV